MQTQENSSIEIINVYSNIPLHLDFFNASIENFRPICITHKPLTELPFSHVDKIGIVIVHDLAELESLKIGCEHCLVIIAKNTLTTTPEHLSKVMTYTQSAMESPQQALETVFHGLITTYFSTEMFLEPVDIYQSDAFEKGQRRINIHLLQEPQLMSEDVKALFNPIGQDDTVIFNFDLHHSSFSLDKVQDLTQIMIKHLGEKFDGEIFYSCRASSKPDLQNLIYLGYLSA